MCELPKISLVVSKFLSFQTSFLQHIFILNQQFPLFMLLLHPSSLLLNSIVLVISEVELTKTRRNNNKKIYIKKVQKYLK